MGEEFGVPARYPEGRTLEEDVGLWWILHTKPRGERHIAQYLLNREISYYLPAVSQKDPVREPWKDSDQGGTLIQRVHLLRP
jgi:hypothetical protein